MATRDTYVKRETEIVAAVQLDLDTKGFTYQKWGGTQTCKPGDWIVSNAGDTYTVDRESFARTYRATGHGGYVKVAPVYAETCAACHGEDARGNQELGAPNLTDHIWLYGGDRATLYETLWHGRGGVMPAFGGRVTDDMIRKLVLHVRGLGK